MRCGIQQGMNRNSPRINERMMVKVRVANLASGFVEDYEGKVDLALRDNHFLDAVDIGPLCRKREGNLHISKGKIVELATPSSTIEKVMPQEHALWTPWGANFPPTECSATGRKFPELPKGMRFGRHAYVQEENPPPSSAARAARWATLFLAGRPGVGVTWRHLSSRAAAMSPGELSE